MDTCTFCASRADSDEHLIPQWILKKFSLPYPMVYQIGDGPVEIKDTPELKLPCACETCNNRWMSGLETTCKKFMGPMIDDFALSLDRQYQAGGPPFASSVRSRSALFKKRPSVVRIKTMGHRQRCKASATWEGAPPAHQ
jgi:hypothetical protein